MTTDLFIIVNPRAGTKGGLVVNRANADTIRQAADRFGLRYQLAVTRRHNDATALARQAARDGHRLIVAAGGDGTVREVATALLETDATLGILPLGSAMNIGRSLGIPRNVPAALEVLRRADRVERIEVGRVHDRVFLEVGGVGFIAGVVHLLSFLDAGRWRHLRTLLRYVRSARPATLTIDADGERHRVSTLSLLVANAPFTGAALAVSPRAVMNDGRFNAKVFLAPTKAELAFAWVRLAFGQHFRPTDIWEFRAARIEVHARRSVLVHADHELVGGAPATFTVLPSALPVVVGARPPGLPATREPITNGRRPSLTT
jgi:YegS/Rv2252/BmrU family lipid kinase